MRLVRAIDPLPVPGELSRRKKAIAARSVEAIGIQLPAAAGIEFLGLNYGFIRIAARAVTLRLPKQMHIFEQAKAHSRSVLALLAPAKAVGLIVFPHHIRR